MDQSCALNILKSGRNVFLTGQAGAGKTYVINQYVQWLWACDLKVAITASTGIAATHIGGVTIHSWSGVGIRESLTTRDLHTIADKPNIAKNLIEPDVLIIDEVSMLSANLLDMVNQVAQHVRQDYRPFGGLQVVCVGDFAQLPPISRMTSSAKAFAFAAKAWKAGEFSMCYLTTQHRQDEGDLRTILNELRMGHVSDQSLQKLEERIDQVLDHHNPVQLYTHNADVDRINTTKLVQLDADEEIFEAYGEGDARLVKSIMKSMTAPEHLRLKVGAQVMFVKNNPTRGYFNGTMGEVVGFDDEFGLPEVKVAGGKIIVPGLEVWSIQDANVIVAEVKQVPLRLAWAITIHKSQGMTLDAAVMDLSKLFEPGQGYVALSRIRSLEGLSLIGLNRSGLRAHDLIKRADAYFIEQSETLQKEYGLLDEDDLEKIHSTFVYSKGGEHTKEVITYTKTLKKSQPKKPKTSTYDLTRELIEKQMSVYQIAKNRNVTANTIWTHIAKIKEQYPEVDISYLRPDESLLTLVESAKDVSGAGSDGKISLKAIYSSLSGKVSYEDIKKCLLFID